MNKEDLIETGKIENISKKFYRNLLFVHGISLALIVIGMVFSTYLLKVELADQVVRTIEGKMSRGDMREVIHILSDAKAHDFVAVDLYDRKDQLQLTFPTRFRRNVSEPKKWWRYLTQANYKKEIFFDLDNKDKAATLVFTFGIFQLLPFAIFIFIFGVLISYPFFKRHKRLLLDNIEKESVNKKNEAIEELARQVSHDYKSPLMAIKSVIDKACGLKEQERKTLLMAYTKMTSILDDLSKENIQEVLENGTKKSKIKSLTHVYSTVLNVVQEKEARHLGLRSFTIYSENDHRDTKNIHNSYEGSPGDIIVKISCSNDDKKAYILIDSVELQRVISNLVENSIESIQGCRTSISREIAICIESNEGNLKINIIDNGQGIPENLLEKVKQKGFSFGKENGEGLGLYSSIKKIEGWGGNLQLQSSYESGTTVTIELPKVVKPKWASSEINLEGIENIVILDDDSSIHQMWINKLKKQSSVPIFNFTTAKKFKTQLHRFKERTLFLLDYELRGERETGLDMANKVTERKNCFIVTYSFQDSQVQRECKRLGVGLFPKTIL